MKKIGRSSILAAGSGAEQHKAYKYNILLRVERITKAKRSTKKQQQL